MFVRKVIMLIIIVSLPVAGLVWKFNDTVSSGFDRPGLIKRAEAGLKAGGLVRSRNSQVEISGVRAAAVYRLRECNGLLVVLPLPPTAQRFEHVVPVLGAPSSETGFVFQGKVSSSYPALKRAISVLSNELRIRKSQPAVDSIVFAFRELGSCGLSKQLDWSLLTI